MAPGGKGRKDIKVGQMARQLVLTGRIGSTITKACQDITIEKDEENLRLVEICHPTKAMATQGPLVCVIVEDV